MGMFSSLLNSIGLLSIGGEKCHANTPIQYTEIFFSCKIENVIGKILIFFLILFKTLIVGTRYEYPQSMF